MYMLELTVQHSSMGPRESFGGGTPPLGLADVPLGSQADKHSTFPHRQQWSSQTDLYIHV